MAPAKGKARAGKRAEHGTLSREQAAELLTEADAKAPGETTADICKKHGVSEKTLSRWRSRMAADPELASVVQAKKLRLAKGWEDARLRFLRNAIAKLETLVGEAKVEQMRDVTGAVKIVGELQVAANALGDESNDGEQPGNDREGSTPSADQGRSTTSPPIH